MDRLPFRQVHLDFHTSEAIPGIGSAWDAGHFQEMLQLGHVDSITVFSKCHHGWSYHPTQVVPGAMHPQLGFDLLGAMIDAAHAIGVRVPAYLSVGLDEKLARTHSHWLRRLPDGTTTWVGWLEAGYHEFCLRSPYLDYVVAQAEEVARTYDADGFFLDIVGVRDCACQHCAAAMLARGQDPRDADARQALGRETYLNYTRRINAAIHAIKPGIRIFHNGGHITRGDREAASQNTHLELESLPTGGWGYDHFPLSARYVHGLGMEFLGMTGKFHTTWGEFGGYKHPNALRYEAALSLANGAKISIGDQMHPFGRLDQATYRLIGTAFAEVEAKESWCHDVRSIADVGVLSLEAMFRTGQGPGPMSEPALTDAGAVRVLQEGHVLFDMLDAESDFSRYRVIILPDAIPADAALADRLAAYLEQGGKILATGTSLLDAGSGDFLLDFGLHFRGHTAFSPEYLVPRFPLADWAPAAFVLYSAAVDIAATHGAILADRQDPFFNRDFRHFSSHQHAPNTTVPVGPAMIGTDRTVYLAVPAFRLYADKGQHVLRELILHGVRTLLPAPALTTSLPAQGIQTVMRQDGCRRTVVHLLYASPARRGQGIEVIEDLLPVRDITLSLRIDSAPARVYLAPQGCDLPFTVADGILQTTVPEMTCHQMVVVEE